MRPYEGKRNSAPLHGLETPGHPICFFTLLSMFYPLSILRIFGLGKIWGWVWSLRKQIFYRRNPNVEFKNTGRTVQDGSPNYLGGRC